MSPIYLLTLLLLVGGTLEDDGRACRNDADCVDDAYCSGGGVCACDSGTVEWDGKCLRLSSYGDACLVDIQCDPGGEKHALCDSNTKTCICDAGTVYSSETSRCDTVEEEKSYITIVQDWITNVQKQYGWKFYVVAALAAFLILMILCRIYCCCCSARKQRLREEEELEHVECGSRDPFADLHRVDWSDNDSDSDRNQLGYFFISNRKPEALNSPDASKMSWGHYKWEPTEEDEALRPVTTWQRTSSPEPRLNHPPPQRRSQVATALPEERRRVSFNSWRNSFDD